MYQIVPQLLDDIRPHIVLTTMRKQLKMIGAAKTMKMKKPESSKYCSLANNLGWREIRSEIDGMIQLQPAVST